MDGLYALIRQEEAPAAPGDGGDAPAQPAGPMGGLGMFLPMILIFVVIYFLMIKPRQKEQADQRKMVENLKKNDQVVTNIGLIGTVDKIRDGEITLKLDDKQDFRIRVDRSAIVRMLKVSGGEESQKKD